MKILVTGAAGFIGFHLTKKLIEQGHEVVGIDNLNDYYDINLKIARIRKLGIDNNTIENRRQSVSSSHPNFIFTKLDIKDMNSLTGLFSSQQFDCVCNLAAQVGVRYSLKNPYAYIESNINGFINILEACRNHPVSHLVYASSSSVYGDSDKFPFSISDNTDHPVSLYAATKKSNELMAYAYSHLYNIPVTGLRFFTVYGPWGRPDMAYFLFTRAILEGKTIQVFNNGEMYRDFTYVDDIVEGISRVIEHPTSIRGKNLSGRFLTTTSHKIYNIGNSSPVKLTDFIDTLEKALGKKAIIEFLPLQSGDVHKTYADISEMKMDFGYTPKTGINEGIGRFIDWYKTYYI